MNKALTVIKIGGNVVDNPAQATKVLAQITRQVSEGNYVILVHGGGKAATRLASQLGVPQTMVDGRRITDAATLDIALMAYAGLINKKLVAQLQRLGCNAIGLSGADANMLKAVMRPKEPLDYGFVGDMLPNGVNGGMLHELVLRKMVPVFCAITHDGQGQLLNTNADTLAQAIAIEMSQWMPTHLIYLFEKRGVLVDANDDTTLIEAIDTIKAEALIENGTIRDGMIPKVRNAALAVVQGVESVFIGQPAALEAILNRQPEACTRIYA